MKKFYILALFAVLLSIIAYQAFAYAPTTFLNCIQPGFKASHLVLDRWPKTGYEHAPNSTACYLYVGDQAYRQYDVWEAWIETASDTWALDDTYTFIDSDGDGYNDTYTNTLTNISVLGGHYVLYARQGV